MSKATKKHRCPYGCMAFHIHEMTDGTFAVFFDDMPQRTGFATAADAEIVMREFTQEVA